MISQDTIFYTLHPQDIDHPKYRLRKPVGVRCTCEGNRFITRVVDPDGIGVFGSAKSFPEAAEDLVMALCDSLDSLRSRKDALGPSLLRELEQLLCILKD